MTINIPIELFAILIAMPSLMVGIGVAKKSGVIVTVGGIIIMFVAILPDYLIMGSQVSASATVGSTTTYTYQTVLFQYTQYVKLAGGLIGSFICISGALVSRLQ